MTTTTTPQEAYIDAARDNAANYRHMTEAALTVAMALPAAQQYGIPATLPDYIAAALAQYQTARDEWAESNDECREKFRRAYDNYRNWRDAA